MKHVDLIKQHLKMCKLSTGRNEDISGKSKASAENKADNFDFFSLPPDEKCDICNTAQYKSMYT